MLFRWQAEVGPTLNAGLAFHGIGTSITKKRFIFMIFKAGGQDSRHPGWIHSCLVYRI